MKIRSKIVLVVLPIMIASIALVGLTGYLLGESGINRIARDFLGFKVAEIQKYALSQYQILLDNDLVTSEEFIQATKGSIEQYARSVIRSDSELILAINEAGQVQMASGDFAATPNDRTVLAKIYDSGETALFDVELSGVSRVAKGFYFQPFGWYVLATESRSVFYQDINRIQYWSGIILAIAVLIALLVLTWVSGRLTSPLNRVVDTMKEIISTSNLKKRVPVEYNDETGALAHTFNIMTGELDRAYTEIKRFAKEAAVAEIREKKIRQIFQVYVPQELIDRFLGSPESMLVGEDRVVSILFSDIRSFTSISEKMHPSDLVSQLNVYFNKMVDIIMSHNGIVDKYIGDAIMAIFGAPVKRDDDAYQSVLAGLEMVDAVDAFNKMQEEKGMPPFFTGIGINYGLVTVGNIGAEKKMDYTVIGDMVNLASRLEGQTKDYHQRLIISESLQFKIADRLPTRLLDTIAVKGKKKGTKIYSVSRELSAEEDRAWRIHHKALEVYYSRDFTEAQKLFEQVLVHLPEDFIAGEFIERCRRYRHTPPPAEWSGVEVKLSK